MKKQVIIVIAAALILVPALSQAAQFAVVGPRALGMGGASVAAVNDSTAVYWNPAALAQFQKVDIRIPAGAALHDHIGMKGQWDEINSIYDQINAGSTDPALPARLDQILTDLDKPETGADVDAHFGLLASIPLGKFAIGLSALGIGYAGMYPTIDTLNRDTTAPFTNPITNNNSAVTAISLISTEPGVALATSIGEKLFIGANAKMMSVKTYVHAENVRTGDFNTFLDNLDASAMSSTEASIDAGVMFAPSNRFSIGVVGRYLNKPSFEFQGRRAEPDTVTPGNVVINQMASPEEIEIEPQFRAGAAIRLSKQVTVTADYDLSKNKTFTPGYEDQTAAAGIEINLPKEIVSFRGGLYKNTADKDSNLTYTAGVGVRFMAFRVDVAGAYDFDEREYQASVDLAARF